jgi:hypothetical protein
VEHYDKEIQNNKLVAKSYEQIREIGDAQVEN